MWKHPDEPVLLEEPGIKKLAEKYSKSPAQIILRYRTTEGGGIWDLALNKAKHTSLKGFTWGVCFFPTSVGILVLPAQKVFLFPFNRWQVQRKVVTIPKSVTPARILQNVQVSLDGGQEFQQCPFM